MKFRPSYLEVKKTGFVDTRMVFEENKKTLTLYETPFGVMNVSVSATSIRLKEEKESIELTAEYALDINNSYMADCTITDRFRSWSMPSGEVAKPSTILLIKVRNLVFG